MQTIAARAHQAFPVLDQDQIVSARKFTAAEERRFEPAEAIYRTGDKNVPVWLILEGNIELSRRDGLRSAAPVTSLGSGQFTGEVGQLSGRPALPRHAPYPELPAEIWFSALGVGLCGRRRGKGACSAARRFRDRASACGLSGRDNPAAPNGH